MRLSDTHTHLHFDQYAADLSAVIHRAEQGGVERILTLGTDYSSSLKSLEIARNHPGIFAAVGIHPTDVFHNEKEDLDRIKKMAEKESRIVAIGEIGLDLYWKEVPLDKQIPVFEQMLHLASELALPVVIHNRDAHREMQDFFREQSIHNLKGVMHSFSGTVEDARFYLERGLHVSFTGVITFKNFKNLPLVQSVPLDRLLLETDSPFLTPVPMRGKRNEPGFVRYVAGKLAEIYGISSEELCEITAENARSLFQW